MIKLKACTCVISALLPAFTFANESMLDFAVPKGYALDLQYYEINAEISLRKALPEAEGRYAAIAFRFLESDFEIGSLKNIGFRISETCGHLSATKILDDELVEYSAVVSYSLYLHGVNLSQDDLTEVEAFLCNEEIDITRRSTAPLNSSGVRDVITPNQ